MASLCREFGISRKTGYKIFERYEQCGIEGLTDRNRRPFRYANQLPAQVEAAIVSAKREKPHWGARKIRERLLRKLPHAIKIPAASTIHAILDRHGLVSRASRPRTRAEGTPLSDGLNPNDLWCADYKGEFQLGDKRYCYPLTVTDQASRFLLLCEGLESTREELAIPAFEHLFRERGLPQAIRSDNGVPFASPHGLFQLSRLSVWWLRLGISIERIRPGHPQQNGRHERMHLTLKQQATRHVRHLRRRIQQRKAPRSARHEVPGRGLQAVAAGLHRHSRTRLSFSRPHAARHQLRSHLPSQEENQSVEVARRSGSGDSRGRKRNLARQLHAVRSRIHRSG